MSEYVCPYCKEELPQDLVEDVGVLDPLQPRKEYIVACPRCGRQSIVAAVAEFDILDVCDACHSRYSTFHLPRSGWYAHEIGETVSVAMVCAECRAEQDVEVQLSMEFRLDPARTVVVNGERVPDMEYDMAAVMAHFGRRPEQVRLGAHEVHCEHCRRDGDASLTTAADYIAAGWRVAPEYPGYRLTCPACYGGDRHDIAA